MSKFEIRKKILEEIFPDFDYNFSKKEFVTWCPFGCKGRHHKKKLQINLEKNVYHCWVCSSSSFITKLLAEKATKSQKDRYLSTIDELKFEDQEVENIRTDYPESFQFLLSVLDNSIAYKSYIWLKEKTQISDLEIIQNKIGFCTTGDYKNRLIFPSFSVDGTLNFYNSRDISRSDRWKYLNSKGPIKNVIFNEILVDWKCPIILVEGIKAYLKHSRMKNVIPIFGSTFSTSGALFKKSILNECPKIYFALDHEAKIKAYKIMKEYNYYGIDTGLVDLEDVHQPDEIDSFNLSERIRNSVPYSKNDSILARLKDIRNNL